VSIKSIFKICISPLRRKVGAYIQQKRWNAKIDEYKQSGHATKSNFVWQESHESGLKDRDFWIQTLCKIASPVVHNLARGELKKNMPKDIGSQYFMNIENVTYLEALGRTMAGIAPWLSLPDDDTAEGALRKQMRDELILGLSNSVNPDNPDYMSYRVELQSIVDAAYIAHGFIRARHALWDVLDPVTKQRFVTEFKSLRNRFGAYNNWMLFSSIIEVFLMSVDEEYDPARINFGIEKMREWYVGDGWYSDGPKFSMDYYNSFVIHPMMVDTLKILAERNFIQKSDYEESVSRMSRHSAFLERMIAPDGTFPPIGRSITYRTGAFQALAQSALMQALPDKICPSQVRCALTKVLRNMFEFNHNFDKNGWLVLGFNGYQPMLADTYTSTGSLYMASLIFLPLGLPAESDFWFSAPLPWSSVKAWQGLSLEKDYKVEF